MIFNIIEKISPDFFWKLKDKCMSENDNQLIQKIYRGLYSLWLSSKACYIAPTAKFKSIPCFPHGLFGVFISGQSKIGKDCVIFHHVTIGSNTLSGSKGFGAPIIGDRCYIGASATIIGKVKIGNNVRIGANCTVYQDVPDDSIIVTGSPRIIRKENMLNRYYAFHDRWVYFDKGKWIPEIDEAKIFELCG